MVRYLNAALHLIIVTHLCISTFAHYNVKVPDSIFPVASAFGGKFKYLTFWNVCLEATYFIVALIDDVLLSNRSGRDKSCLKEFLDYMYNTIIFPLSMMVMMSFWGLYLFDKTLLAPNGAHRYYSAWLNHSVHTVVALYSILEMFVTYRALPTLAKSISGICLLAALYIFWVHVVYYVSDMWVYPILAKLSLSYRILLMIVYLAISTALLFVGRCANSFIWKNRIRDSSRKLE